MFKLLVANSVPLFVMLLAALRDNDPPAPSSPELLIFGAEIRRSPVAE